MTDEQIEALVNWLERQAYYGVPGTDGEYLRMAEMRKYLRAIIKTLAGNTDENI